MFLPLAERMTQKYVTDGKIEAEAGIYRFLLCDFTNAKIKQSCFIMLIFFF